MSVPLDVVNGAQRLMSKFAGELAAIAEGLEAEDATVRRRARGLVQMWRHQRRAESTAYVAQRAASIMNDALACLDGDRLDGGLEDFGVRE